MKLIFVKQRGVLSSYVSKWLYEKDINPLSIPTDNNCVKLLLSNMELDSDNVHILFIPENTHGWFERIPEELTVFAPDQNDFNKLFTSGKSYPEAITEYLEAHPQITGYVVVTSKDDYVKCNHPAIVTDGRLGLTVYESAVVEYFLDDKDMTKTDIIMNYFDNIDESNPGKLLIKKHQAGIIRKMKQKYKKEYIHDHVF